MVAVIAAGGFLGGPTRYLLGQAFPTAGRYGFAALNIFGSLFSGLVATALGIFLARAALVRRSPGWSRA